MGLQHLHDVITKTSVDFVDGLLLCDVAINMKVDQAAFVIKKQNGAIKFFGRGGAGEIDTIKRVGMDTYEDAISHIESQNVERIPDGTEAHMEVFSDKWKTSIQYDVKPTNNLILSYVVRDGQVLVPDDPTNQEVADVLNVSPPPVLFSGQLSEQQRLAIKSFITLSVDHRKSMFGGENFLEFVSKIFDIPQSLSWLHSNGCEGLVLYFKKYGVVAKIVDPIFTQEKQDEHAVAVSIFKSLLNNFVYDFIDNDVPQILKSTHNQSVEYSDVQYIRFITQLVFRAVEQHGDELRVLNQFKDDQLSQRYSNVSPKLAPVKLINMIKTNWWVEELFVTLLNSLKTEKRAINTKQGLTKERKDRINEIVGLLREKGLVK